MYMYSEKHQLGNKYGKDWYNTYKSKDMLVHADSAGRHPTSWGHLGINSLNNLNMSLNLLNSCITSHQGCVISWSSFLYLLHSETLLKLPYSKASPFSHFFLNVFPTCLHIFVVSSPAHHSRSTLQTTPDSQSIYCSV